MINRTLNIGIILLVIHPIISWANTDKVSPRINTIIATDNPQTPLYLATQSGLYLAKDDGQITLLSQEKNNLTALAKDNHKLFSGGQTSEGANIGLGTSEDNGKNWTLSITPSHFTGLSVGKNQVLYGLSNGVVRSNDGGKTWIKTVQVKENIYNIAASKTLDDTVYITMDSGLLVSRDGGINWKPVFPVSLPALSLTVTSKGKLWTYIAGKGLIMTTENKPKLDVVYNGFGQHVPMHATVDESNHESLYILGNKGQIWLTSDNGKSWDRLGGIPKPQSTVAKKGETLFNQYCASCHGNLAVGESYSVQSLTDQKYIMAPALDGSAHAWHHTDEQLTNTILKGSPRTVRMPPWEKSLTKQDSLDIITYFKGFWGRRELECQGPKHMNCPY